MIHRPTGRKLGYGALAKAAASLPVPSADAIRLKNPSQFRYIGTGKLKPVDAGAIVVGRAQYGDGHVARTGCSSLSSHVRRFTAARW